MSVKSIRYPINLDISDKYIKINDIFLNNRHISFNYKLINYLKDNLTANLFESSNFEFDYIMKKEISVY